MSNIPITSLPLAISLDGSELVPMVQGGTTKRTTIAAISTFPASGGSFVMATSTPTLLGSRLLSAQVGVTTVTDGGPLGNITVGIATNGIGNSQIRQGGALSVIGNAGNATANVADISAASDFQVLRRSGTTLGFGALNLASSNAVTGILPPANGGTGVANASTLTLGGNLTTVGAFASTFTMTGATSVTFPTSGTLATTAGPSLPAVVQGDLLYGSGVNTLTTLAKNTSATRYLSNTGTTNNPAWAQVDLTNGVANLLPLASGGTNANLTASNGGVVYSTASALAILAGTATARLPLLSGASTTPVWGGYTLPAAGVSGGIPYFSSTTAESSSALLTANALVLGGGAGTAPATLGSLGTTTTVLHGNAAGAPTFGAVSLTADVSGLLPLANGGTNANLTASNGGIFYSTASAGAILAGTATAGQHLQSGTSAAPSWTTATFPSTAAAGTLLAAATANTVTATPTPTLGANGGTGGQLTLNGSTSGSGTIRVAAAAGTGTIFQLPPTNGTLNYLLQTDGSGNTSWVPGGGTGTVTSVAAGTGLTASPSPITTTGTISLSAARQTLPTTQSLTTGAGATYTTPANCLWIEVYITGGGGGGGGTSTSAITGGSNGSNSIFNSINATGGLAGGVVTTTSGGAGGSGGTGTANLRMRGGPGLSGATLTATSYASGGGGNSYFGGGGTPVAGSVAGTAGFTNSGGGGGGASNNGGASLQAAPGGGAGETAYLIINSPAGSYTYTIGGGGAGGVSTQNGGAGGSGFIFVIEHYGS